jgi:hypothetical protein
VAMQSRCTTDLGLAVPPGEAFYCAIHGTVRTCPWRWMDCRETGEPKDSRHCWPIALVLALAAEIRARKVNRG